MLFYLFFLFLSYTCLEQEIKIASKIQIMKARESRMSPAGKHQENEISSTTNDPNLITDFQNPNKDFPVSEKQPLFLHLNTSNSSYH